MWILVTQKGSIFENKILELREGWCSEIYNGTIVWFIDSVNGECRLNPDYFEINELEDLEYTIVDEKALNLLAFL